MPVDPWAATTAQEFTAQEPDPFRRLWQIIAAMKRETFAGMQNVLTRISDVYESLHAQDVTLADQQATILGLVTDLGAAQATLATTVSGLATAQATLATTVTDLATAQATLADVVADLQAKDVQILDLIASVLAYASDTSFNAGAAVTTTRTVKATATVTVPAGFTKAQVWAFSDAMAYNSTASDDYLYVGATINAYNAGESYVNCPSGYATSVSLTAVTALTGLTGGDPINCTVSSRTGFASWAASSEHLWRIQAVVIFSR